jgi:hypothetical protein
VRHGLGLDDHGDLPARARRRYVDPETGNAWVALEVAGWGRFPRCDVPSLLFVSQAVERRVWEFPADWAALSDAALVALSWAR